MAVSRNAFNLESSADGAVLEIKIGAGAFTDIVTGGVERPLGRFRAHGRGARQGGCSARRSRRLG